MCIKSVYEVSLNFTTNPPKFESKPFLRFLRKYFCKIADLVPNSWWGWFSLNKGGSNVVRWPNSSNYWKSRLTWASNEKNHAESSWFLWWKIFSENITSYSKLRLVDFFSFRHLFIHARIFKGGEKKSVLNGCRVCKNVDKQSFLVTAAE